MFLKIRNVSQCSQNCPPPKKKKLLGKGEERKYVGVWLSLHPLFIHFFMYWALSYIIMQANDNFF